MNKQEIFKAAHEMARTFVGAYAARFALALKTIYKSIKRASKMTLRFVKMHSFMVIETADGRYEQHEVVSTRAATHDWQPAKFVKEQALDADGKAMFEQLWNKQNKPVLDN